MLQFTHNSKKYDNQNYDEMNYEPIIITNGTGKQKLVPETKKSQKKIVKTHSNSMGKNKHSLRRTQPKFVQKQWSSSEKNAQLFDNKLKKDAMASQQRRFKLEKKRQKKEEQLLKGEDKTYERKFTAVEKDKDREIQNLKRLIQKQRIQKQKNDILYEEKKRIIEKERKQLIKLEEQVQWQGPKKTKEVKEKIRQIDREVYPANDKPKCHQQMKQYRRQQNLNEITQSESIANQRNTIRQKQLEYLTDQRQRNHLQYQKNTFGYTPTLVPLLSRASYKIVSTHISSLVQLFVDDLLEEQVYLLQAIQLETRCQKEKQKQKNILRDYSNNLQQFINETQRIQDRIGRYDQMKFQDLYLPKKFEVQPQRKSNFDYSNTNLFKKLQLNLSHDQLQEIEQRKDRFIRLVSNFDEYKPRNMKMFAECTEELLDEALLRLAKELDSGSGQFVDIIFRNEFA